MLRSIVAVLQKFLFSWKLLAMYKCLFSLYCHTTNGTLIFRTKTGIFPAQSSASGKPVIRMDALPPAESRASWSWEEGGLNADPNQSSESSGIAASSDSVTTAEGSVTSDASSTFREGPMGLMGSLRPLMRTARSMYSIYENWRGLPKLQVRVSLV